MKIIPLPHKLGLCLFLILLGGCTDHTAEANRAKEEADAKARSAATRKEMDALPSTFQSRDYFKRNSPPAKPASGEKAKNP